MSTQCCICLKGSREDIESAVRLGPDLCEWRFDLIREKGDFQEIREKVRVPHILTVRSKRQGGDFEGSEEERRRLILELAPKSFDYVDVEWPADEDFCRKVKGVVSGIKLIVSYHDFEGWCEDLEGQLEAMRGGPGALFKLACKATTASQALDMLSFAAKVNREGIPFIGIAMGEAGQASRILAPLAQMPFTFASVGEKAAPGQVDFEDLMDLYRFRELDRETQIFGLIGDPIGQSPSHIHHNRGFQEGGRHAVYLKFRVIADDLAGFMERARAWGFSGLSVTLPHKEKIVPLMDRVTDFARKAGAVNTVTFTEAGLIGDNTDACGAVDAMENVTSVSGKKILLLGAGGAARAIAFELMARGGRLTIANRTKERGEGLVEALGEGVAVGLEEVVEVAKEGYDFLVNATSVGMGDTEGVLPIPEDAIVAGSVVMDTILKPVNTALLKVAKEKGCPTVTGYDMFVRQAEGQWKCWFQTFS